MQVLSSLCGFHFISQAYFGVILGPQFAFHVQLVELHHSFCADHESLDHYYLPDYPLYDFTEGDEVDDGDAVVFAILLI